MSTMLSRYSVDELALRDMATRIGALTLRDLDEGLTSDHRIFRTSWGSDKTGRGTEGKPDRSSAR